MALEIPYVLKKNGMYYAHKDCGYVSRVLLAELYEEHYAKNYAKKNEDVSAIPINELLTGASEVKEYLDRMQIMYDTMKLLAT